MNSESYIRLKVLSEAILAAFSPWLD